MFGSGDDKKSKQPVPSTDSESPDTSAEQTQTQAEPAAPAKKGLFSWFGRKKAEAKAEQPRAAEAVPTEASETDEQPELPVETTEAVALDRCAPTLELDAVPAATPEPSNDNAESVAATLIEPEPEPEPEPEAEPLAVQAPTAAQVTAARPSRFSLSVGREVTTPVAAAPQPEPADKPAAQEAAAEATIAQTDKAEPVDEHAEPALEANLAGQSKPQGNKLSWFARLKQGLAKTSSGLGEGMASLFLGKKEIDDDLLEELETRLLTADVGMEATTAIMNNLTRRVARKELADSGALYKALQGEMADLLRPVEQPLLVPTGKKPYVILVVGVNGAGKTTTIGKLASRLQKEGKKVMLAAGDTFRAAAVEQLQVWGERNKIPVIAQHTGADSASVIFDAVQAAQSRGMDVLIADTAGRLHTKDNLMEELRKVARVMGRLDDSAPHEVLLVLDAGTGQNAINQTRHFNETIPLTGLALTKLDGTAKGGVIFALAKHFAIPVRYIGVGEGIDDLRDFVADDFVSALFAEKDSE